MQLRNRRILENEAVLEEAKQHLADIIREEQEACDHKDVGETENAVYGTVYGRVCLDCGAFESASKGLFEKLANGLVYKLTGLQYQSLARGSNHGR